MQFKSLELFLVQRAAAALAGRSSALTGYLICVHLPDPSRVIIESFLECLEAVVHDVSGVYMEAFTYQEGVPICVWIEAPGQVGAQVLAAAVKDFQMRDRHRETPKPSVPASILLGAAEFQEAKQVMSRFAIFAKLAPPGALEAADMLRALARERLNFVRTKSLLYRAARTAREYHVTDWHYLAAVEAFKEVPPLVQERLTLQRVAALLDPPQSEHLSRLRALLQDLYRPELERLLEISRGQEFNRADARDFRDLMVTAYFLERQDIFGPDDGQVFDTALRP